MFTFPFTMMSSADGAYTPSAALLFDGAADTLSRTFSDSDGTEFIFSVWVKRTSFSDNDTIFSAGSSPNRDIYFFVSNKLYINLNDGSDAQLVTSGVFFDPTAWYHILVSHHHGEGTASDRIKVYVNGVEPSLGTTNYPSSSTYVGKFNENQVHYLGSNHGSGSENWFSGYMADPLFIDTKSIQEGDFAITDFGGFDADTGIWVPKDPSTISSFGTNGFWINGSDPSFSTYGVGKDVSGNNNHFTPSSMVAANVIAGENPVNDVENNKGNQCTFNPIFKNNSTNNPPTFSNGNLTATSSSGAKTAVTTIPIPTTGKWSCKTTKGSLTGSHDWFNLMVSKASNFPQNSTNPHSGSDTLALVYSSGGGTVKIFEGGSEEVSISHWGTGTGNVEALVDRDANTIKWYMNGSRIQDGGSDYTTNIPSDLQGADCYFSFYVEDAEISITMDYDASDTDYRVALATQNLPCGYTGSLSDAIVTANATEANIKATTEGAHSFSNWISILYNRDASEQRIFYASDDSSNYIPFADDGVLGKNSFPTLAGSNNWTGCAIKTGADTGIATGTISHTNGGGDSTGAHGLTSPTSRFSILISSEATSSHDGWFWFHPDMTANNNIRLAQGGSEGQQSSKYYAAVTSSNAVVKSAAPSGTYRYIVFAENDLVSFYKYVNVSGTDSAYVHTNNKPHWMLWGQMTETGGGYGQYLAWSGTHNPYNPWTKCTRIHNISTNEITGSADILGAGFKVREDSPGQGAWHQTDGQTTCGISIGTPFPLNNRAK